MSCSSFSSHLQESSIHSSKPDPPLTMHQIFTNLHRQSQKTYIPWVIVINVIVNQVFILASLTVKPARWHFGIQIRKKVAICHIPSVCIVELLVSLQWPRLSRCCGLYSYWLSGTPRLSRISFTLSTNALLPGLWQWSLWRSDQALTFRYYSTGLTFTHVHLTHNHIGSFFQLVIL